MTFEIEQGIPIPEPVHRSKYPLAEMGIGESFFVPGQGYELHRKIQNAVQSFQRRDSHGRKFTTRLLPDGVRVWRTS